ncbi:MAG: hypothetical protein U5R14_09680 [Gemmatimonadota bacterium]|nr:hypothetical protein [Gemmatimonadota bacterium]
MRTGSRRMETARGDAMRRAGTMWALGATILGLLGAAGCAAAQASADDASGDDGVDRARYTWRGEVPAGGTLEIKGVNGAIRAEAAGGSEAVVTATFRGRRSDPASVRIERVEHAGGITFCAMYPTPSGEAENTCEPGSGGRMNTRRNDVEVEFRVEVPSDVPFRGRTVNGSIDVRMGGTLREDVSFETVNGRIRLDLPDDLDADLDVRWLNGGLDSDLPITITGRMGRGRASGTLGAGGPVLRVKTVNGSIRIR